MLCLCTGNWELTFIEGLIGIAVHTDDQAIFQRALSLWRARVPAYFYLASDGPVPKPDPHKPKMSREQVKKALEL